MSVNAQVSGPSTTTAPAAGAESAPSPQAPKTRPTTADVLARINAKIAAEASEEPSEASETPAEGAEPTEAPPEPKQRADRIAAALLKAERAEAQVLAHKRTAETSTARVRELETQLEALKSDPLAALAHAGFDPEKFGQAMIEGKFAAPEPFGQLPPEVAAMLEEHKQLKAERERQAEEAQKAQVRGENLTAVRNAIAAHVEEFPVLSIADPERLLDGILQVAEATGEEPAFADVAREMQAAVLREMQTALKHEQVLDLVLSDESTKAALLKRLGAPVAQASDESAPNKRSTVGSASAQKTPPKSITNAATRAAPSRQPKPASRTELAAAINKQLFGK